MPRKLGAVQKDVLESLRDRGYWIAEHSGWLWDTTSNTRRILESLVKRGLVKKRMAAKHPVFEHSFPEPLACYEPAE